jgi:competence protein ComEC
MAGPLLNLVAVPVMAIVQVAGMVVVLTDAAASIARPTGWLAYAGAMALTESARLIDIARWLTLRVPPPSPWLVVGYYTGLLLAVCGRGGRRRWCGGAMVVVAGGAMVLGVGLSGNRPPPGLLRWTVFDVGQGDSTLLQWRDRDLLVDAGGAPYGAGFDIGGRVLAPALWARGVRTLTTLGITHGDPDHLGGAAAVVDVFAPASLWLGLPVPLHQPTQELIARAAAARIDLAERRAGEDLEWGGVRLRVLNPPAPDWERRRVRNDDSIVIEVHYGDVAILLTGDISAAVERAIAPQLTAAPIRILKVAHHGSRTSTSRELLEAWRPQIAVISCGRGNTFGHPAPEVVDRLAAMGARIYRTDRDGEVTVDTDGRRVSVRTFVGGAQ